MQYEMYADQDGMNPFDQQDNDDPNQFGNYDSVPDDGGLDLEQGGHMNGQMNGHMNGHMNGGHMNGMQDHGGQDFSPEKKLQLAERANEIYRQQLRYMQDHLASLRSLIQDKEYVIENLMLRFDLGILQEDPSKANTNLNGDEINQSELVRKAEALAQRTILENFELREMVNELRDENFHLRNEIYELQDRINRQVLQINKLEKTQTEDGDDDDDFIDDLDSEDDQDDLQDEPQPEDPANTDHAIAVREARAEKRQHRKNQSSVAAPKGMWDGNDEPGTDTSEEPDYANTDEARAKREERAQKRSHRKQQSSVAAPKGMWKGEGDGDESDVDSENSNNNNNENNPYANTDAAIATREQRQAKHKKQKSSVAPPKELFQDENMPPSESDDDNDNNNNNNEQGTKRRGSQVVETPDPRYTDAAVAKREARQEKHHRRESSGAQPNIWDESYSPEKGSRDAKNRMEKYSKEAVQTRNERKAKRESSKSKHHKRKSSVGFRQFIDPDSTTGKVLNTLDPKDAREKEAARRQSIMDHLNESNKGHLSDPEINPKSREKKKIEKPGRYDFNITNKQRKKSIVAGNDNNNIIDPNENIPPIDMDIAKTTTNIPSSQQKAGGHHRRKSSEPVPDLGLEDTEVLLHWEKLRVKDLQEQVERVEKQLKQHKESIGKLQALQTSVTNKEQQLEEAYIAKGALITKCSNEITRLTLIINSLLSIPKIRDIVEIVIQDSITQAKKQGLL